MAPKTATATDSRGYTYSYWYTVTDAGYEIYARRVDSWIPVLVGTVDTLEHAEEVLDALAGARH